MDKFPEAFRRFEDVVDTDRIHSYSQLKSAFETWTFQKKLTYKQDQALQIEAKRIGIKEKGRGEEYEEEYVIRQPTQRRYIRTGRMATTELHRARYHIVRYRSGRTQYVYRSGRGRFASLR